jgi:hypothetical protein
VAEDSSARRTHTKRHNHVIALAIPVAIRVQAGKSAAGKSNRPPSWHSEARAGGRLFFRGVPSGASHWDGVAGRANAQNISPQLPFPLREGKRFTAG